MAENNRQEKVALELSPEVASGKEDSASSNKKSRLPKKKSKRIKWADMQGAELEEVKFFKQTDAVTRGSMEEAEIVQIQKLLENVPPMKVLAELQKYERKLQNQQQQER